MSRTQLTGSQVGDASIQRRDLDTITAGQAVVTRLIAGSSISFTSTGIDSGTGDVTINATNADFLISSINAATRLIQTQRIMARLVLNGQIQ